MLLNGVGLGFLAVQVSLARRQALHSQHAQTEELRRVKRQATLEFASRTMAHRHSVQATLPDDFDKVGCRALAQAAMADPSSDAHKSISSYLTYMETLAMGISSGIFDLETADSLFGSRFIAVWDNYRDFVLERRGKVNNIASLYRELEWLAAELVAFRQEPGRYTTKGKYIPLALRTNRGDGIDRQLSIDGQTARTW